MLTYDCDLKAVDLRKVRLVEADLYSADLKRLICARQI